MTLHIDQTIPEFDRYNRASRYQRIQYNDAYADWFQSKVDSDEWRLFTCTVVFKPVDIHNYQSRYEDEYTTRFLKKIRRRLERSPIYQSKTIPIDYWYYFEYDHKTLIKSTSRRCPFHIHSVLPIRTNQVHRFWDYDNNKLNSRLFKDLHSIDIVQDVLIEPMRDTGSFSWLMYITKEKSI